MNETSVSLESFQKIEKKYKKWKSKYRKLKIKSELDIAKLKDVSL